MPDNVKSSLVMIKNLFASLLDTQAIFSQILRDLVVARGLCVIMNQRNLS